HLALIMLTLGFGLLLAEAANSASALTGGADGLQGFRVPGVLGFKFDMFGRAAYAYALLVLFLCFLVARRIIHSPFGLALRGIRENPLRMPAMGAPYALIGPNGAGKTTLINLLTGMLSPDSGQIFLGPDEITALKPHERVRRGLARTFQINALFPRLTALESVTLAILERERHAHNWWRGLAAHRPAIDEASTILASLNVPLE